MQNSRFSALLCSMLLASVVLLSACSAFRFPGVFKIDVGQGNIITQAMLDKLKPGMTERQVLYVMGSPMIKDTFHANRWDYYYSLSKGGKDPETQHIIVYFNDGQYTHHQGELTSQKNNLEPKEKDRINTDSLSPENG